MPLSNIRRQRYARLHGEQARAAALQTLESQRNQVELLQKQIDLAGIGESQRAVIIAQLQAEQQLRQKGIDLASAEGQAILANAAKKLPRTMRISLEVVPELERTPAGKAPFVIRRTPT